MAKFSEEQLTAFTKPPSDTEETRLRNSERMVKEAIAEDPVLRDRSIHTFGQGSYANDTNVRLNSDVDVNVKLLDVFFFELPSGTDRSDFGLNSPSDYRFGLYKDQVEAALVRKVGRAAVTRHDKCITVSESTNRAETDVVPTFTYKRYSSGGSYVEGVEFKSDQGKYIKNFPLQHIDNGKRKNANTQRRFKRLTRIYRRIRYTMIDDGIDVSNSITSFLVECLVWNVPNRVFNDNYTWTARFKQSIVYLYENTTEHEKCKEWGEVSELLYLFHSERKWTYKDVNNYLIQMWNYLEF